MSVRYYISVIYKAYSKTGLLQVQYFLIFQKDKELVQNYILYECFVNVDEAMKFVDEKIIKYC